MVMLWVLSSMIMGLTIRLGIVRYRVVWCVCVYGISCMVWCGMVLRYGVVLYGGHGVFWYRVGYGIVGMVWCRFAWYGTV